MRDRPQHCRLDRVAAPQRLGLDRLALEPLAVGGDGEQRGERGQEAAPLGQVRRLALGQVQRPDETALRLQLQGRFPGRRRVTTELDPGALDAEDRGDPLRDRLQLVPEVATAEQVGRDVREQLGLVLSLPGLAGPPAGSVGEHADHDGDRQVRGQREPVRPVRERERVLGRQVEPVEREHARDRHRNGVAQPPENGDDDDGEDVEDAEAEDGDERLEELDRGRDDDEHADTPGNRSELAPADHRVSVTRGRPKDGPARCSARSVRSPSGTPSRPPPPASCPARPPCSSRSSPAARGASSHG